MFEYISTHFEWQVKNVKENRKARRGEEAFWRDLTENWMDVNHLHRTILERKLNQNGLYRSQHQLLMYISDHPNQSQKEIARLNRISPATAAVTLKKLEKGGYIHRVADDRDNRCNQICLTEKGKLVVEYSIRYFSQEDVCGIYRRGADQADRGSGTN